MAIQLYITNNPGPLISVGLALRVFLLVIIYVPLAPIPHIIGITSTAYFISTATLVYGVITWLFDTSACFYPHILR